MLRNDLYAPELDAICRAGNRLSRGCQAIRDREIVDASAAPWRAIGRVNFASTQLRSHCTGTLVSARIVLTAAHCLYNFPRKAWLPPESLRFVAGYQRGAGVAVSGVERFVLDPVQDTASRDFSGGPAQDWALLILKDPIGRNTGYLTVDSPETHGGGDGSYLLAGYAGLRPHVLSTNRDCGPPQEHAGQKVHLQKCPAMAGDSGAPILTEENGRMRVVGVLSSVAATETGVVSIAIPVAGFADALSAAMNE
ncbi:trypsin-like serine peptidase [Ruegeria marisrubri]|nr:trypsin-like serine protease [Ruegeria marisrubri]